MLNAVKFKSEFLGEGRLRTNNLDIFDTSSSELEIPIKPSILESVEASLSTSRYG